MKPSLTVISYILIAFQFNCCKDKDPKKQEDLGFLSLGEAKDYVYFKPGTYWIYKNSLSNALDTIGVIESKIDTIYMSNEDRKYSYEDLTFKTYSKTYQWYCNYYRQVPLLPDRKEWFYFYPLNREKYKVGGAYLNITQCFQYPFDKSHFGDSTIARIYFVKKYETLKVHSIDYLGVVEFEINDDPHFVANFGYRTKIFWAKNYGIIKYQRTDNNEAWELIDSHILQ